MSALKLIKNARSGERSVFAMAFGGQVTYSLLAKSFHSLKLHIAWNASASHVSEVFQLGRHLGRSTTPCIKCSRTQNAFDLLGWRCIQVMFDFGFVTHLFVSLMSPLVACVLS